MAPNESGSAILALFATLIDTIKQARPVRSDDKPLGGGMVYSLMVLGMPIDPKDYSNPWSPMGGSTLQATVAQSGATPATPATPPAGGGTGAAVPNSVAADPRFAKAMQAAFKTASLANIMLQVTTDGTYLEYPVGRHISFQYEGIVNGMQPGALPPIDPAVQKQIDDAARVLHAFDSDGNQLGPTPLFKAYRVNATAYALAKANYATQQAKTLADPTIADTWPQISVTFQSIVDQARDDLKTGGAEKVERALDIIESVGISMQDHMIAQARKTYDVWDLGLAGVPDRIPYSFFEPSSWCDPTDTAIGWQGLHIDSSSYHSFDASGSQYSDQGSWRQDASSNSGGVSVGFAMWSVSADVSHSDASSQWQGSSQYTHQSSFKNSATNLTIDLEYGLVTIYRPWLISDLFYMDNWYLIGNKKHSISDGTIGNQVGQKGQEPLALLPLIPQQFLVIRNVSISASDWGEDGATLSAFYSGGQGSTSSDSTSVSAGGGVSLGFVNFGGHGSHSDSHAEGQSSDYATTSASSDFGTTFINNTLTIKGAQIIAFLSDIVPASPPLDAPPPPPAAPAPAAPAPTTP